VLTFNDAFDEQVRREWGFAWPARTAPAVGPTNWDALSLVEDREVEIQISAERFGARDRHRLRMGTARTRRLRRALLTDAAPSATATRCAPTSWATR
jgi:hypothetical protein